MLFKHTGQNSTERQRDRLGQTRTHADKWKQAAGEEGKETGNQTNRGEMRQACKMIEKLI